MKLFKKTLIIITIVVGSLLLLLLLLILSIGKRDWGTSVDFENELGVTIDSIQISVCDTKTMCRASKYEYSDAHIDIEDTINNIYKNISTPEKGYPCSVELKVYTTDTIITLQSDKKFDCPGCDIYHKYKLTENGALYEVY